MYISTPILIHLTAAIPAFVLGTIMMIRRKGDLTHKILGRLYMILMLTVAISSLFIRNIRQGEFSLIHILSLIALINIPMALWYIRRGNRNGHRQAMIGLYLGLLIAGSFAFLPGRLLHTWLIGF